MRAAARRGGGGLWGPLSSSPPHCFYLNTSPRPPSPRDGPLVMRGGSLGRCRGRFKGLRRRRLLVPRRWSGPRSRQVGGSSRLVWLAFVLNTAPLCTEKTPSHCSALLMVFSPPPPLPCRCRNEGRSGISSAHPRLRAW